MDVNISDIRKLNLSKLIEEAGSATRLAKKAGTAPAYISQIMTGAPQKSGKAYVVGDKVARRLERAMNKPDGWMDREHLSADNDETPGATALASMLSSLGDKEFYALALEISLKLAPKDRLKIAAAMLSAADNEP